MRAAPANAVCFLLYEKTIKWLDEYFLIKARPLLPYFMTSARSC